jgi:hypothetical protein
MMNMSRTARWILMLFLALAIALALAVLVCETVIAPNSIILP